MHVGSKEPHPHTVTLSHLWVAAENSLTNVPPEDTAEQNHRTSVNHMSMPHPSSDASAAWDQCCANVHLAPQVFFLFTPHPFKTHRLWEGQHDLVPDDLAGHGYQPLCCQGTASTFVHFLNHQAPQTSRHTMQATDVWEVAALPANPHFVVWLLEQRGWRDWKNNFLGPTTLHKAHKQ